MMVKLVFPREVFVELGSEANMTVRVEEAGNAEEVCRQKWIDWSSPKWKAAGRSDEWIANQIVVEWRDGKEDIMRRCRNGEFDES